ncbi:hypothetical protein BDZ97DRAFT_1792643 [Flammula alnicola]|nr:hypothetical protein BDZ97DRAFT_1792643 [Flammula alnicola]
MNWKTRYMDLCRYEYVIMQKIRGFTENFVPPKSIQVLFSDSTTRLQLDFMHMALALAASLLMGSFSLLFIYYLLFSRSKRAQKPRQKTPIALGAIQALSSVFTPTSVAWPIPFTAHFERSSAIASSFQPPCMELDLSELIDHIYAGKLELRNSRDLSYLLRGRLRVYGWNLKLYVDRRWWTKTAKWIASQHLFRAQVGVTLFLLLLYGRLEVDNDVLSDYNP